MIKQVLFDGKVEVGISEISDGNMRFFGDGNENEIIENQKKLGKALDLSGNKIARIRTIYSDRKSFTDYHEITDKNLLKYAIVNSEKQIPVSDGLATKCSNIGILLPLADCNPEKLKVYFSPHALYYQVYKIDNKLLTESAKEQLIEAGILLENIVDYKVDTVNNANLPSHSSGDTTQRFAIVVKQN